VLVHKVLKMPRDGYSGPLGYKSYNLMPFSNESRLIAQPLR